MRCPSHDDEVGRPARAHQGVGRAFREDLALNRRRGGLRSLRAGLLDEVCQVALPALGLVADGGVVGQLTVESQEVEAVNGGDPLIQVGRLVEGVTQHLVVVLVSADADDDPSVPLG